MHFRRMSNLQYFKYILLKGYAFHWIKFPPVYCKTKINKSINMLCIIIESINFAL